MAQKSKVKAVTPNGTYEGKYGLMYKFDVEFENGEYGTAMGKTQECKFVVGMEASYERTSREYNGQTYYNVKYVNESYQGGGGYKGKDPKTEARIVRMNVLQRAVDLAIADKIKLSDVPEVASQFAKWVNAEVAPQPAPQPVAEPSPVSDLPF